MSFWGNINYLILPLYHTYVKKSRDFGRFPGRFDVIDGLRLKIVDFFAPILDEILIFDINTALGEDTEQEP